MFSLNSSSLHTLNADKNLSYRKQQWYFYLNKINNMIPAIKYQKNFSFKEFTRTDLGDWNGPTTDSPSRKLSDLFWQSLPWDGIKQELGEIRICDTGCGNGEYAAKLQRWSGSRISSYIGFDMKNNDNWAGLKVKYPNIRFMQLESDLIGKYIPADTNCFITQSALEHLVNDITYFYQLADYIRNHGKPVIQIHLIPSPICLILYGLHGVRQYTPRTVMAIFKLFKHYSYAVLYRLGGKQCNSLHYELIRRPILEGVGDLRQIEAARYDQQLKRAIYQDIHSPIGPPTFYAFVIHSYWKQKYF